MRTNVEVTISLELRTKSVTWVDPPNPSTTTYGWELLFHGREVAGSMGHPHETIAAAERAARAEAVKWAERQRELAR